MRTFIALELPEEMKDEIVSIQRELQKQGLFEGRITERENLHLTLKFLGEISEEQAEEVKKRLEKAKFGKFEVKFDKAGVFNENFIRIMWVGLFGERLFELQKQIDELLGDIFPKEERFMAHITIARPKFVKDKRKLIEKLKSMKLNDKNYVIERVCFKKSELKSGGPEYSDLLEVRLR